jgi:hypothetical protein
MENPGEITAHFTSAAAIVYGIEYLKQWGAFSWITTDSKKLNRIISAIVALVVSLGITFQYNKTTGDLIIHNLTLTTLGVLWDWAKQYLAQQVIYDGVIAKDMK